MTTHQVVSIRNMYQPDYMLEGSPRIVFEGSIDECRKWVDESNDKSYCTSNGEAGAPELLIIPAICQLGVGDGVGKEDCSRYNWNKNVCEYATDDGYPCGECRGCLELMMEQDCDMVRKIAID